MISKKLELVFSDKKGKVYNFPGLKPAGMKAGEFFNLDFGQLLKLPSSSELFLLPDRAPVGIDPQTGQPMTLGKDPYAKSENQIFPVAAFIPPGYTLTHNAAYRERDGASQLPLFAYGACVYSEGDFYVSAVRVDEGDRHDEKFLKIDKIEKAVHEYANLFPKNRLIPHLTRCALANGCANAKNFFLGRLEVPIPVSPVCNAQCQGCISLQPEGRDFPETQKRINFVPSPEEISELVLYHFEREADPIVSFGQGCEGEPSIQNDVIEKAIRLIRRSTSRGLININTNASRPEAMARLFEAGLNNIRVSANSVREPYYSYYYQPKGYSFKDVAKTVSVAKKFNGFVSMNYLSMPGFTDSEDEFVAFCDFISECRVDMVQWRNLNYDPVQYFRDLKLDGKKQVLIGMDQVINRIRAKFPGLLSGYFNPTKSQISKKNSN